MDTNVGCEMMTSWFLTFPHLWLAETMVGGGEGGEEGEGGGEGGLQALSTFPLHLTNCLQTSRSKSEVSM